MDVDQLVLVSFPPKQLTAPAPTMLPIYLEARLANCENFDDNGILSINFFSTYTATATYACVYVQMCTQNHFHAHICYCFSWLFSSHTHRDTYVLVWVYMCVCVTFGQTVFVAVGLFSHVLQLPMQIELPSVSLRTQVSVYLFSCACECDESMRYQAKLCYTRNDSTQC